MDITTKIILDIMQAEEEEHEARMRMAAVYLHLHRRQHKANSISRPSGSDAKSENSSVQMLTGQSNNQTQSKPSPKIDHLGQ
ncbi:hypothetical protein DCAR_0933449 [Daucus carota subsp. sativus]|uniref:Uncharacterized protein n=1 Tax=Daucus carota subsp. sativus TaxID=79200 RepID=A0A175YE94_DAUCS|nr:hypothetical protein DCAR_0933449 [Daucus carota subsp. sativus]